MSDNKNQILTSSTILIDNQNQEIDTESKVNGEKKADVIEKVNGKDMAVMHLESKELAPSNGTKSSGETLVESISNSVELKENELQINGK